jgi:hypothetical protein
MTAILSKSMAFSRYSAISFIRRPNGDRKNAIAFKPKLLYAYRQAGAYQ